MRRTGSVAKGCFRISNDMPVFKTLQQVYPAAIKKYYQINLI